MLHGRLRYHDEHFGTVEYEVYGNDNFDGTKLYIVNGDVANYTNYVNAGKVFDKHIDENGQIYNPYEELNPSDNRRLDIKRTNKYKTNITNETFCLRVAAILRYMQISGRKNYNQNLGGEDDHFSTERVVKVDDLGYIKYEMGLITEIYIKGKYVELGMKTIPDDVFDDGVFKELKEKDRYGNVLSVTPISNMGFKLATELLGFEYTPPIKNEPVNVFGMFETIEDVIAYHEDKNTSWILDRKYVIVTDDMVESIIQEFMDYDGFIAFDTETTGLNINFKSRTGEADELVGVVLSKEIGTGYYFPLQHKLFDNVCNGDHWYFMERYMKPLLESKRIIGHNISFDWKVAYIYDINVNFIYDTMLAFGVTKRYEEESYQLALSALVKNIFGLDMFDLDDFVTGSSFSDSNITFADLPYEIVRRYAPADADMTLSLFEFLEREAILAKYEAQTIFDLEVNFAKAVAYAEFYGYHIDIENIPTMREQIEGGMERHKARMFEIAGKEFNPNSPQQLMKIMYDELGIEQIGEKRSTNKEILGALAERTNADGEPLYPFVVELKAYRDYEGIHKNFLKRLHEFATPDGYIFSTTRQLGTDTGRTSATDPNYQSYNDPVKKNIIPRKGYIHFDSDFSQIEYRVLASLAGQENLMKEFDDPDLDYHTYQASRMFGIPYSLVSKSLRNQSKGINFGLPYGMGDSSLGARIFGERTKENEAKAAQLRRKFFQGQEKIEMFFERVRSEGVSKGYTSTHWGRRRYYHRGTYSVNEIRRQAGNHVIQGCLDGNTRIQTKEYGIVKIKDVVGQSLHVWDGEQWSKGLITYSGKKKKCIVRFSGGQSIICSPIHKFLVMSHRGNTRFVNCTDLRGSKEFRNPHRVVINRNYTPSDFVYSSENAYKYSTSNVNSRNVFLEDIGDSFAIGVVLGRLASDGSFAVRDDGGSYLQQFIAEHESSIVPILKKYMEPLGVVQKDNELREGRSEKITHLLAYSKSLIHEISDLDIKHSIHDNIFMDTELLRGFLRGFFDGDGGITGKSISLVFGTQADFEPMCLDIQKALLFFGIRSRYRKYEDRHVVQVKTNDIPRFLDLIGFINTDKQARGNELVCVEKEEIFGPCLLVESVEVTDEYIDMYDVCNTDRGYYVADGVITHNTAADIYKIAVTRLFNRIVDEGWLGLVLINVFVHDELLLEVHHSINMYYFFKAWREEFELSIDGFCKLYAGAGVGFSWYDAKGQDLPVQYIDEIIAQYHDGMEWHGDLHRFLDDIERGYEEYKIRRVREYITDPANQGEVIKPIINSLLVEVVGNIIKELQKSENAEQLIVEYNAELSEKSIPLSGKSKLKLLRDYLTIFCKYYGLDINSIDIKSPDEAVVNPQGGAEEEEVVSFDDDEFTIEDLITLRGYFRDEYNRIVYFVDRPMTYNGVPTTVVNYLYSKGVFKTEGTFQLALYDETTKETTLYNAYINEADYQLMVQTYNNLNGTSLSFAQGSAWGF